MDIIDRASYRYIIDTIGASAQFFFISKQKTSIAVSAQSEYNAIEYFGPQLTLYIDVWL